jgi:hypothetical protein
MKKCFSIFLFLTAFSLSAQTAAEMDALLETNAVTAAVSARFVLDAAGLLPSGLSGEEAERAAYDMAVSEGWLKGAATDTVNLRDTAFLVMRSFGFKGGIMYSLFQSPRYGYREMVYLNLIQGRADPAMLVSGRRLLQIIGRALTHAGDSE